FRILCVRSAPRRADTLARRDSLRDSRGNGVLHVEDRREVLIETLCPELLPVGHSQQSRRYSQSIAAALERTVEHRIDAQLATRCNRILIERTIAAHRAQRTARLPARLTEVRDQRFRHAELERFIALGG